MNVIILAAGMGKRMGNLTKNKPKCFLKVNGESLIERLIKQLRNFGVKDISIVTGYKSRQFKFSNINFFLNKKYKSTNMVYSLIKAKKKLKKDTLIFYSDIFLSDKIIKKMLSINHKDRLSVAIDSNWKKYWTHRFKNINQDLETLRVNKKNQILEIGKKAMTTKNIDGRFIGIIRFPKKINKIFLNIWTKTKIKNKGNWGVSGKSLNKAYMTDLIDKLIEKEIKCYAIKFKNGWYEFDNKLDYYKFKNYKLAK